MKAYFRWSITIILNDEENHCRVSDVLRKIKDWDRLPLIPLVFLALWRILSFPIWLVQSGRGLPSSPDGDWYLNYSRALLENFSISLHINEILYLGYNLLLTGLLALFKDPVAVVYIQAVAASLSVIFIYQIANTLFNKRTGIIASLFYIYNWDVTLWSTYLISDSFFVSLLILCVYLLIKAMDSGTTSYRAAFVLTALYMSLFRPAGIVILTVMLLYILCRMERRCLNIFWTRYRTVLTGVAAILIFGLGSLYFRHVFDGFFASLQYNAKLVLYNLYAKGRIYDIATAYDYFYRPNYTIDVMDSLVLSFFIHNWDAVCVLFFRRTVAFFGTWAWETNFRNLGDYIYFSFRLLPAFLFATGTLAAIRDRKFGRAAVLWWIVFAVFVFCILLFIDAMYRYRFPAMPFIGIIAAYGLDRLITGGFFLACKMRTRSS